MHPKSIINSPLWKYSSITIRKKICNDTLWRFTEVKHKYGFLVLIFATTAMFFLQDKKVQVLCESCSVVSDSLRPTEFSRAEYWMEWAAVPFSRGSSQPRNQTQVSCIACGFFTSWARRLSPRRLVWVAYPFFSGSSWPRNRTGVSRIAGGFFTNWAIREAALNALKETILRKKFPLKKSPHKSSLEDLQYFQVFTPCYIGNKHLPDKNVVASLFLVPLSTPRSSPQAIGIST